MPDLHLKGTCIEGADGGSPNRFFLEKLAGLEAAPLANFSFF